MKTALQQLIDKWKGEKFDLMAYSKAIKEAESFLEIEKQQIIDAHNSSTGNYDFISGQEYYDKNFCCD